MAEKVTGKKVAVRASIGREEWLKVKLDHIESFLYRAVVPADGWKKREAYYRDIDTFEFVDGRWRAIRLGEMWGAPDRIGFFRKRIRIPSAFAGQPVALLMVVGGESTVFINGVCANSLDPHRDEVPLTERARPGQVFDVLLESHVWSFPDDERTETAGDQHCFRRADLVVVDREVESALYDFRVAYDAALALAGDREVYEFVMKRLEAAANMLDRYEQDRERFKSSLRKATARLRREIYGSNAYRVPGHLWLVANSHLDIAFHWWVHHGARKARRTMAAQLALMAQYPDFIFCQTQPQTFQDMKVFWPELYARVKKTARRGQLEPIGGMWIEPDGNIPSGESFVRQVLHGKRFWSREFGVDTKTCWLPDVFGCTWIMPQILLRSGIRYFVTHKQSTWNDTNKWPHTLFVWRGPDGSEVLGCIPPTHFIGEMKPEQLRANWEGHAQKDILPESMYNFGWGNGGGGPTRPMIEYARRLKKFPGFPTTAMSKAEHFLNRAWPHRAQLPVWEDELYLEMHRGTPTTKAILKKRNRQSEFILREAEIFSCFAERMGMPSLQPGINDTWKGVLMNQFHDILPGSHVNEVAVNAIPAAEKYYAQALELRQRALARLAAKIDTSRRGLPIVVFNSLNWCRSGVVTATLPRPSGSFNLLDAKGSAVPFQVVSRRGRAMELLFLAEDVPSLGYKAYHVVMGKRPAFEAAHLSATRRRMENAFFRLKFDDQGYLTSIYDKRVARELLVKGGVGNRFQLFEDKPGIYDAWDIILTYREREWPVKGLESIEVAETGPVRAVLRMSRKVLQSRIAQDVILYTRLPRVDFVTHVDWRERQKLLKVGFPLDLHAVRATYDLDYGNIERPTHRNTTWDQAKFEVCAHKWADVSEADYGVSLMNDCKYGHDIARLGPANAGRGGNLMRLTLLKGSIYPDEFADLGGHDLTYALYPHLGDWRAGGTVRAAYELNLPLLAVVPRPHRGTLKPEGSWLAVDAENVVVGALKRAEDSGDILLRLVELHNERRRVQVSCGFDISGVTETNLLEEPQRRLPCGKSSFTVEIRPYEIRTFVLKR